MPSNQTVNGMYPCGLFAGKDADGNCKCYGKDKKWDNDKCVCVNGRSSILCNTDVCEIGGRRLCRIDIGMRLPYGDCRSVLDEFSPSRVPTCKCNILKYDAGFPEVNRICNFNPPPTQPPYNYGESHPTQPPYHYGESHPTQPPYNYGGYANAINTTYSYCERSSLSTQSILMIAFIPIAIITVGCLLIKCIRNKYGQSGYAISIQLSVPPAPACYPTAPQQFDYNNSSAPAVLLMPYGLQHPTRTVHPPNQDWQQNTSVTNDQFSHSVAPQNSNEIPESPPPSYDDLPPPSYEESLKQS